MADVQKTVAPTTAQLSETDLVKRIKDHLKEMENTANQVKQTVLQQALYLGDLLLQAKAKVTHGRFGKWIEKNCDLSERSAQRYMLLKEQWPKVEAWMKDNSATVADLSLRKAEQIVAPQKKQNDPAPDGNGESKTPAPDNVDPLVAELPATIKHHEEPSYEQLQKALFKEKQLKPKLKTLPLVPWSSVVVPTNASALERLTYVPGLVKTCYNAWEGFDTAETASRESVRIEWPALSVVGAATPEAFFSAFVNYDVEGGLVNRFLGLP